MVREFSLQNTTYALQSAENAIHLVEQKGRLEKAVLDEDAPLVLDTAKALLESVFKTVVLDRANPPKLNKLEFSPLYKAMRELFPFNNDVDANELIGGLGSGIVHNLAQLRNKFGAASHGDDGYFETPIDMNDAELIAYIVDGLAGYILRKHKDSKDPFSAQRIYYSDYPEFNSYLDGQYPSYQLDLDKNVKINVPFSEIVFRADEKYYRDMLLQYRATEESDLQADYSLQWRLHAETAAEETEQVPPVLAFDESDIADISSSLIFNEEVRISISDIQCREIAEFVRDYALNKAGIDWHKKMSELARFRLLLKRRLIKVTYAEPYIDSAVELLLEKAKQYYSSESL